MSFFTNVPLFLGIALEILAEICSAVIARLCNKVCFEVDPKEVRFAPLNNLISYEVSFLTLMVFTSCRDWKITIANTIKIF